MNRRLGLLLLAAGLLPEFAETAPSKPSEFFRSFLAFRFTPSELRQLDTFPVRTLDDKNGYCELAMSHGGDRFTFAVWKKEGGRVFGFTEPNVKVPDTYIATFWTNDAGKWTRRDDVIPSIGLEDFSDESTPIPDAMRKLVNFDLVLPRSGTTIAVRLIPATAAKYDHLDLVWNPKAGRFIKGPKRRN